MKKTENFNLNLPELNDNYNVEDTNSNMSIIDAELKIQSEEIDEAQAEIEEVQEEMDGVQGEVASMRTEISSAQTGIANAQAKADSTQAEVETLKANVKTISDTLANSNAGVNISFDGLQISNNDTNLALSGYIRGDIVSLNVSGWVGNDTVKNNIHMRKIIDNNAEYEKMFEQFDVYATVPYNASTGGYRRASISIVVGKGVVTELVFTNKSTGEKKYTYEINDYINNSAYEWTGTIDHNGVEILLQNMPDVTMATYPLCVNASMSRVWEGE